MRRSRRPRGRASRPSRGPLPRGARARCRARSVVLGVLESVPPREAEQRLVARVVPERIGERVARGEIDPEARGSARRAASRRSRRGCPGSPSRGSAPHSRSRSRRSRRRSRSTVSSGLSGSTRQGRTRSPRGAGSGLGPAAQGDLEGSPLAAPLGGRTRRELKRPAGLDPALDIVETSHAAELVKLRQLT